MFSWRGKQSFSRKERIPLIMPGTMAARDATHQDEKQVTTRKQEKIKKQKQG